MEKYKEGEVYWLGKTSAWDTPINGRVRLICVTGKNICEVRILTGVEVGSWDIFRTRLDDLQPIGELTGALYE